MAIKVIGYGGAVAEVDGSTHRALRIANRPVDYGILGVYAFGLETGIILAGIAANAEVFQFRWTDNFRLCAVTLINTDGAVTDMASGSTPGWFRLEAMVARRWSADGSGGTAATLTGDNQKLRTATGTSVMGTARISTTAALTAGTKTLDNRAIGGVNSGVQNLPGPRAQRTTNQPLFSALPQFHPLILGLNEGYVVRVNAPATGNWYTNIHTKYAELVAF